jgi:subtilisin-like proprotein convertase family protein/Ca2+-binding RTX toxin-like protein
MTEIVGQVKASTVQSQVNVIATTVHTVVPQDKFVFWAGIDGTKNIASNPEYSDDKLPTAIGEMGTQIKNGTNIFGKYYPGVATPGTQFGSSIWPLDQSEITARQIINDYAKAANKWLLDNPSKTGADITMMMSTFSRGSIAGAMVTQILQQEGLVYKGTMLIPPGQATVSAALVLSPVNTGSGDSNLAFVGVKDLTEILALDEYRSAYKQTLFPEADPVFVSGNHGDVGSFYDKGIGGIALKAYTDFFNTARPGMMGAVSSNHQYDGSTFVDIHKEDFSPLNFWNISYGSYAENTPVQTVKEGTLPTVQLTANGDKTTFVNYKGDTVVTTHVNGVVASVVVTPDGSAPDIQPFSYTDKDGNRFQTKTDAQGKVLTDINGDVLCTVTIDNADGSITECDVTASGKYLSVTTSTPTTGSTTSSFILTNTTTALTTNNSTQNENAVAQDIANGTALATPNYEVTFTAKELNATSFYESTIAGFATDGIRPGDMNILPAIDDYLSPANVLGHDLPVSSYNGTPVSISDTWISTNLAAGQQNFQTYVDPLILDINGDGIRLTSFADRIVLFDIDHDNKASREQTGWVKANTTAGQTWNMDGILVYDLSKNGKIDGIHETLSQYYNGKIGGTDGSDGMKNYTNGFEALKNGFDDNTLSPVKLNSNGDNIFNAADAGWSKVRVWIDANANGQTDTGELKTLAELGITSINLSVTNQSGLVNGGNEVRVTGSFTQTVNGVATVRSAQSVDFIANPAGSTFSTTDGNGVKINTEAVTGKGQAMLAYVLTTTVGTTLNATTLQVQNLYGNIGNDNLIGDANANWLAGSDGADTLNAGEGNDVLLIDSKDTQIDGGDGNDIAQVIGNQGVVLNLAQSHIEAATGGRGKDFLYGGGHSTVFIRAGAGDDIVIGSAANDVLSGEDGDDLINGGASNDLIRGHRGRDQLLGGAGDDILQGGQSDDRLNGGDGNDVLNGNQGDDVLDGGAGADLAEFSGSYADYRITQLSATTYRIVDTKSGRDGVDTLSNIEKLSFKDVSWVGSDLATPMPVKDILVKDASGLAFNHAATHTISKTQLLGNDIDRQNDILKITSVSDVQGGTAKIDTATGDVIFTPDANYKGLMGFKYSITDTAGNLTQVTDSTGQTGVVMKAAVYLKTPDLPTDPLMVEQWYLSEANILPVWKDYTGKGVRIGQFEPGSDFAVTPEILDITHPDLKPNLDQNWLANPDNTIPQTYNTHSTLIAGVMVAAKNSEGGVGVAYDAKVAGYYIANYAGDLNALNRMAQYDIANNSWGVSLSFASNFIIQPTIESAYQYAAAKGRNGLGSNIIMSGGNERAEGGNTNYESFSNNRYSITVGGINATTDFGSLQLGGSPFSNPGANILISAPVSNVTSSSRFIEADNGSTFGNDYAVNQGTSFAVPIVSGVVALMLEANPNLGYRDVQEILAVSSKKVADVNTQWQNNHATNWNGGAMHISHDYGFGEVDALAAVRLSETWATQQTWYNEFKSNAFVSGSLNTSILDNNAIGISKTLSISNLPIKVEHVEVTVNLTHANAGDLIIKLISPTGTESILMNQPGKAPGVATDIGDANFNGSNTLNFTFDTVRDWGEAANGNWTLQVVDAHSGATGTLNNWNLKFYGKLDNGDDTYYYTNEITSQTVAQRTLVADTGGGEDDAINVAAVSGNSMVNLSTGIATIAGTAVTFTTPANLENIGGGEGNDPLTGHNASHQLGGGGGKAPPPHAPLNLPQTR